ncbi:hypothetical protein BOH66_05165 [Microbacterium aurum]|uniref:Uncharacterized protein n=1 Tax=Microbacterium aurum TaxID=36805 RepID=A0A1P8U6I0_9MICO|nr:hypothetical protein BOH66_05165 [Microbacterium aurum]
MRWCSSAPPRWNAARSWVTQSNGTRPRTPPTTAGDMELRIPKLRQGSFTDTVARRIHERSQVVRCHR